MGVLKYHDIDYSGGGLSELPIASEEVLGGVRIDGETITITEDGVISSIGGTGSLSAVKTSIGDYNRLPYTERLDETKLYMVGGGIAKESIMPKTLPDRCKDTLSTITLENNILHYTVNEYRDNWTSQNFAIFEINADDTKAIDVTVENLESTDYATFVVYVLNWKHATSDGNADATIVEPNAPVYISTPGISEEKFVVNIDMTRYTGTQYLYVGMMTGKDNANAGFSNGLNGKGSCDVVAIELIKNSSEAEPTSIYYTDINYTSSGGSGASAITDLTDVNIDSETLSQNQVLKYDEETKTWFNDDEAGGAKTWEGTQAEYDALPVYDPDTMYFITDNTGSCIMWRGTRAQYDALGEYDDNTLYIITDEDLPTGGGVNYSTEEQDTGLKGIDGKTVFQKSYYGDSKNTVIILDENINGNTVILYKVEGSVMNDSYIIPIFNTYPSGNALYVYADSSGLILNPGSRAQSGKYIVTIQYTKNE